MKKLSHILDQIPHQLIQGSYEDHVSGVEIDSRLVVDRSLFIAIAGSEIDGHLYISSAIERGAGAIIASAQPKDIMPKNVALILVSNTREIAGLIAANFFDRPSQKLKLVGITGTNGKTSIVQLSHKLFMALGHKSGLLSTIENKIGDKIYPSALTTPDAVSIQKMLANMVNEGCTHAFMEVSSHALHQHRVTGCAFAIATFTNITHDHLDYHGTFDEYIAAKKSFFDRLDEGALALVNLDDRHALVMLQNTRAKSFTYALKKAANFKGKIMDNSAYGLHLQIDHTELHSQLVGAFNASNLLAVYAIASLLGQEKHVVLPAISALTPPLGRMEIVYDPKHNITAFVDYAHTPDALQNVLETIAEIKRRDQQVITVVGCGGNRDATKRPLMAKIAIQFSDKVILTSDNPRNEDPEIIIAHMEAGIPRGMEQKTISIVNRKEAIKVACAMINKEGIILVAGKGHELYQEIKGVKHPFDDREILKTCFGKE